MTTSALDPASVSDAETQLNSAQAAVVAHRGNPLLVVAGAGTGKTKTLVARVSSLISEGADPARIMLLTFSRRAAAEMLDRVGDSVGQSAARQVWGGTFHAVANRMLRIHGAAAGLPPNFTVLDQADVSDLFGLVRSESEMAASNTRAPKADTIASIYGRIVSSQSKLSEVLAIEFPWCAPHEAALGELFDSYTKRKRRAHLLDYDDLLLFWRGLLAHPQVGPAMASQFDHVLVDEYQDTNPIQADIVEGLVQAANTELCAVGDDAQAIYGFRSATVANMWAFEERFGGERLALEQNYRSTPEILAVANAALGSSTEHFEKNLWTERPTGARPTLVTCHDEAAQSALVCDQVLEARDRGIDLRDQAVLFRTGHHSDHLELELTRRNVPFVKYGGLRYLEAAHIKDVLALLRVLDNPLDELAWQRSLLMLNGVGPGTVRRLRSDLGLGLDREGLARFTAGEGTVPGRAQAEVNELRAAWGEMEQGRLTPAEELSRFVPLLRSVFGHRYENSEPRLADIGQLATTAQSYETRSRFLTELTLDPPGRTGDLAGRPHLDDDWLTLSTIHSAKGGEWRRVNLIHAADGNLPADMALASPDGLSEELRLFYVALTRAKDELVVSAPLRYHVNRYGSDDRHLYAQLSRFIQPLRNHFDESATASSSDQAEVRTPTGVVGVADEVDALLGGLWS